jgi:hypothetical protein
MRTCSLETITNVEIAHEMASEFAKAIIPFAEQEDENPLFPVALATAFCLILNSLGDDFGFLDMVRTGIRDRSE